MALVALLAATACTGGHSVSPPSAAVGRTSQAQRIVVRRVGGDRLTLKWAARCADGGVERAARRPPTVFSPHDGSERLLTLVRDGDRYRGSGRWREDGTDGDYELVTATATARVHDAGGELTITGTLRAEWKTWNGEGHGFDGTCVSGSVPWTAVPATPTRAAATDRLDGWITGDATTTDGRTVWAVLRPPDVTGGDPYRLVAIDAATGRVAGTRPIGVRHTLSGLEPTMAFVDGSLWISRPDYGPADSCTIDVVDPATGATTRTLPVCARSLTPTSGGEVWTSSFVRDVGPRVDVIDGRTGAVVAELDVGDPTAMAAAGARVWVKASNDRLKAIDRATRAVVSTYDVSTNPSLAPTPDGGTWVTDTSSSTPGAWRIGPDGRVRRLGLPAPAESVSATPDGGAWFVSTVDLTARRVDADGDVTKTVDLPTRAWWALTAADGGLVAVTDHGVVRVAG